MRQPHYRYFLMALLLLCTWQVGLAKQLATMGNVYPIGETDFLQMIQKRLLRLQQSGQLMRWQDRVKQRVIDHTLNPAPVAGLTTTVHPHTTYFDPSVSLSRDITDLTGRVLVRAGTRINPLDDVHLDEVLLFLNAADSRQIMWAKREMKKFSRVKLILVGGNIKAASKKLGARVYFDQAGKLSTHFRLKHIPVTIQQVGKRLAIKEYKID